MKIQYKEKIIDFSIQDINDNDQYNVRYELRTRFDFLEKHFEYSFYKNQIDKIDSSINQKEFSENMSEYYLTSIDRDTFTLTFENPDEFLIFCRNVKEVKNKLDVINVDAVTFNSFNFIAPVKLKTLKDIKTVLLTYPTAIKHLQDYKFTCKLKHDYIDE